MLEREYDALALLMMHIARGLSPYGPAANKLPRHQDLGRLIMPDPEFCCALTLKVLSLPGNACVFCPWLISLKWGRHNQGLPREKHDVLAESGVSSTQCFRCSYGHVFIRH